MASVRRPFDAKDVGKMNTVSDCHSCEAKNAGKRHRDSARSPTNAKKQGQTEHGFCTTFPQNLAPSAQRKETIANTQDQAPSTQGHGPWILDLRCWVSVLCGQGRIPQERKTPGPSTEHRT